MRLGADALGHWVGALGMCLRRCGLPLHSPAGRTAMAPAAVVALAAAAAAVRSAAGAGAGLVMGAGSGMGTAGDVQEVFLWHCMLTLRLVWPHNPYWSRPHLSGIIIL